MWEFVWTVIIVVFVGLFLYSSNKNSVKGTAELIQLKKQNADLSQEIQIVNEQNRNLYQSIIVSQNALNKANEEIEFIKSEVPSIIVEERQKAIKSSQAVIKGKTTEQIVPFLPNFKYNPSNCRFLGSPIDFVIFDGMYEGKIREVIIMDVKTGNASLTQRQKDIQDCIKNGKISFEILKM